MLRTLSLILSFVSLFTVNIFAQTDTIPTPNGDIIITPILHATMAIQHDGKTIYMDPYGGAERFAELPTADLVIITHIHGDHTNIETLQGLDLEKTTLVAPQSVIKKIGDDVKFQNVHRLNNGEEFKWEGMIVAAVPMYNLPETEDSRHPKGRGNGYVLTIAERRIYISGDTEDIQEMRNLKDIDLAFVCMNLPYTMTIEAAASAVLDFAPKIVYPFHYRGKNGFSDVGTFKKLVNTENLGIEVRLLDWYEE
ncbi:MAG: MBL fold metallo-hydrolase [Saprospiraceae bacterium]